VRQNGRIRAFAFKGATVWRSWQQQRTIAIVYDIRSAVGIPDVPVEVHSVNVESFTRQSLLFHLLERSHVDLMDRG